MSKSGSVCEVDDFGNKCWFLGGKLHREDGPAIQYVNGGRAWFLDGKCHRVDGPAVERANGGKEWWVNGVLHRVGGPAIERADGSGVWYLDGERFGGTEFLLDVGVGVGVGGVVECGGGWFPVVLVVDGVEFGR